MIQQKTALKCQNLQSWKSTHYMVGGHLNLNYRKLKGQSRMDNPEIMAKKKKR